MNEVTPPFEIPENGKHIWDWFREINSVAAVRQDGQYQPIKPSEYLAWQQITGNIVYPAEYDIMFAMDAVFCDEMNKEIESRQEMWRDRKEREMELKGRR